MILRYEFVANANILYQLHLECIVAIKTMGVEFRSIKTMESTFKLHSFQKYLKNQ